MVYFPELLDTLPIVVSLLCFTSFGLPSSSASCLVSQSMWSWCEALSTWQEGEMDCKGAPFSFSTVTSEDLEEAWGSSMWSTVVLLVEVLFLDDDSLCGSIELTFSEDGSCISGLFRWEFWEAKVRSVSSAWTRLLMLHERFTKNSCPGWNENEENSLRTTAREASSLQTIRNSLKPLCIGSIFFPNDAITRTIISAESWMSFPSCPNRGSAIDLYLHPEANIIASFKRLCICCLRFFLSWTSLFHGGSTANTIAWQGKLPPLVMTESCGLAWASFLCRYSRLIPSPPFLTIRFKKSLLNESEGSIGLRRTSSCWLVISPFVNQTLRPVTVSNMYVPFLVTPSSWFVFEMTLDVVSRSKFWDCSAFSSMPTGGVESDSFSVLMAWNSSASACKSQA